MIRTIAATVALCGLLIAPGNLTISKTSGRMTLISVASTHPVNRIVPSHALGAGVDGHGKGVNDLQLTAPNVAAMLSAGLTSLTYRLRTELAGEVWHWNPTGTWSDPQKHEGYWISGSTKGKPLNLSYGYRLPRRGNTIDQANDDGFSKIDDGDPRTFWKSNPYLSRRFTGEPDSLHPQWIVLEFGRRVPINAVKLNWDTPFAKRY